MTKLELKEWITELACSLDRGDLKIDELMNEVEEIVDKNVTEQLTLTDVVATLPNINSNLFKNWLKVNKYAETMNRLVYSKKDWDYDIDVLYRAFTNEIEFGN
mgnify:CR=1 FL=1|tara:strand:- start:690 stop:998 length:309 start_codon:yes stop_codon:yes gene_type:complete